MSPETISRDAERWEMPAANQVDEGLWRAWVAKGREQERRTTAKFYTSIRYLAIAALLVGAGLGSRLTPYDVFVRFTVSAAAVFLTVQSLASRRYATAALFGLMLLLFNPVAPVFSFSGDWQRAFIAVSAAPFAASFAFGTRMGTSHA